MDRWFVYFAVRKLPRLGLEVFDVQVLAQTLAKIGCSEGFGVWGDLRAVGAFSALLPTSPWPTSKKRLAGRLWALRGVLHRLGVYAACGM